MKPLFAHFGKTWSVPIFSGRVLLLLTTLFCLGAWGGKAVAAVTYQAAGTGVGGTTGVGLIVPWPAHVVNDIALLFVESTGGQPVTLGVANGFVEVTGSPQTTGTGTGGTRLTVFWARATSAAMAAPVLGAPSNHVYARIVTFRGVINSGDPFDGIAGGVKATASTGVSLPSVTTTVANALIVQAVARDNDNAAAAFSAQTNASLTGIAERLDAGTANGNGGGLGVWSGVKATAGATGTTTATVTSSINAFITLALKPQPVAPTYQAVGGAVNNATTVSPAWPAHAIDDIALLFVESGGGEAVTLSVANGFAPVTNSPQATGAGTAGTRLTVFWARATSTGMLAPTVSVPVVANSHIYARIVTYRNAINTGDPLNITGGGVKTPATTSVSVSGVTTTVPYTRIVQAVARDNDSTAAAFSAETNANLTGIAERTDAGTTTGAGGGFVVWDGVMAPAGGTGITTATMTISSTNAFLTIALAPKTPPAPAYQALGTAVTAGLNWPAHAVDDIALLFVESTGGQPVTLSVANGFAPVANSPQATGTTTNGTRLTVFWARATSTAMPGPALSGTTDHVYARILTYRGAINTGDPWDVTGGGVKAAASTSVTVTSVTTTVANTLVVQAAARSNDSSAAAFGGKVNANLTGIAERSDAGTTTGNGGGIGVWDGAKATAGATGNTVVAVTSSINAFLTIALKPPVVGPNHVELIHDGEALTCTPKAVTVLACTTAASCYGVPANQYTATTLPITMTPIAGATWCSDSLCATPLPSPAAVSNGTVIYLRDPNLRTDRMAGTASTATTTTIQCSNTATLAPMDAAGECDVDYADSGFVFDVPNHRAEVSQTVTVSALKSGGGPACTPAFVSVSKSINFKCSYANPATGTLPVRVGGAALNATNNVAQPCDATGRNVTLAFNASGVASTTVRYADAGSMGLGATYTGSGADAGLVMTGTDSFVAAPGSFSFSGITAAPIKAGSDFAATVTALNSAGVKTPNFGNESPQETATLSHTLCRPTGAAADNGSFTPAGANTFTSGVATLTNLAWSEVGNIDLTATLTSGDYLGSVLTVTGNTGTGGVLCNTAGAGNVGRFIPDHFDTAITAPTCAFNYSGQPMTATVTAMNGAATPTITVNYDGSTGTSPNFAKDVTLADANALGTGSLTGNAIAAGAFVAGEATATPIYTFTSAATAPGTIKLRASDADVTTAGSTEATREIRSGRLRISNAYGSELLSLPMPAQLEYFNSSGVWILNGDDNCTTFGTLAGPTSASLTPAGTTTPRCGVATGSCTAASGVDCNDALTNVTNGSLGLCLTAPGVPGSADIPFAPPAYLQFNGVANPFGRAGFGIYNQLGNSRRIIYRREVR